MHILNQNELDKVIGSFLTSLVNELDDALEAIGSKTHDPLILALELSKSGQASWEEAALTQAIRKNRENKIGDLHEDLFNLLPGWQRMPREGALPDLVCEDRKFIVELKSRSNTVSGGKLKDVYDDLLNNVNGAYKGYVGIYGYVLNEKPTGSMKATNFAPSDNKTRQKRQIDPRIWKANGRVLWALATDPQSTISGPFKDPDAIFKVYDQVLETISKMSPGLRKSAMTSLMELSQSNFSTPPRKPKTPKS